VINRIILIGNGFDLAHEMPTSYNNFIANYWSNINQHLIDQRGQFRSDDFSISYIYNYTDKDILNVVANSNEYLQSFYKEYGRNNSNYAELVLNNHFLFDISKKSFDNWVDIENEYYEILLLLLDDKQARNGGVEQLNKDLLSIKNHLHFYLENAQQTFTHSPKIINHIKKFFDEPFKMQDFSEESKRKIFSEKWERFKHVSLSEEPIDDNYMLTDPFDISLFKKLNQGVYGEQAFNNLMRINQNEFFSDYIDMPEVLTFNYTTTEELYEKSKDFNITHIHGELNKVDNPLIFGYGDELDDSYSAIEKLRDNKFLDNMKSINYSKTKNYKHILSIIESGLFQVYIFGHSCGNSDRTLLNTIFEHDNCASIKIFYYQDSENTDKYLDTYKNISRNFNDKAKLRDRVVNWQLSEPLVPFELKKQVIEDLKNSYES
jgi:hypothetical protein